ncbi:MAG TPA: phage scaffolding protein [Nocardioides sp.]
MAKHNPFAFNQPITLDNLDQLFAHHRARTGGWFMEEPAGGNGGGGNEGGEGDKPAEFAPITSQEELDRRIGPRLAREREKYADYNDLKAAKAEYDKLIADQQTDQEKAVATARQEGETAATQRSNALIISMKAETIAATEKARNPEAVVKLLDLSSITVDADGAIDTAALKAKVDELKTSDPYLFDDGTGAKPGKPKADRSQGGGGGTDTAGVDRGREMFAARRKKTS